ncbi:MAG: queuosine precursor transporter [Myxococcaceae bacterium]|nr:queuosine precursor transporter [Myxococcaceae bacterium]
MHFDRRTQLFVVLAATFVACFVVGDIIGGKLLEYVNWNVSFVLSAGMVAFPVTFLITDLLNEFYGHKAARFVTWVGFGMAILSFSIIAVTVALPWPEFTRSPGYGGVTESAFDLVFASSRRILVASMCAYLIGQFADIATFRLLKRIARNRYLWLRATGSTVVSQLIDTLVVTLVAWWGTDNHARMPSMIATSYAMKLLIAIGLTPLIYAGHAIVERALGIQPVKLDNRGEVIVEPSRPGTALTPAVASAPDTVDQRSSSPS